MKRDTFFGSLFDLKLVGGHFFARFEAHQVNLLGTRAERHARAVGRLVEILRFGSPRAAHRRAGHVERHVPPSDDHHPLADIDRLPRVDRLEEIDAMDDAGGIRPFDIEVAAFLEPGSDEDRFESFGAHAGNRDVRPHRCVEPQLHAQREYRLDLHPHEIPGEPVNGNACDEHPAGHGVALEDRQAVSQEREVVRRGKSRNAGANDRDFRSRAGIRSVPAGIGESDRGPGIARFHAVLFRHKALESPDRHRFVDAPPAAFDFAGSAADTAAYGGKGVRRARDPVSVEVPSLGDRDDIPARIGADRASPLTFDLALPVLDVRDLDAELTVHDGLFFRRGRG